MKLLVTLLIAAMAALCAEPQTPTVKPEDRAAILEMQRDLHAAEVQWLQLQESIRKLQATAGPLAEQIQKKLDALKVAGYELDPSTLKYSKVAPKADPAKKTP